MKRFKYPRTYHLPWSEGASSDDKVLSNIDHFDGINVVITEKMDGENTTLYSDYFHARSLDSKHHWTQSWIKLFRASISYKIPKNMRICGENMYAKHSIHYSNLPSYFLGFSVWIDNVCLDWYDTMYWFEKIGIEPVPIIYNGPFTKSVQEKMKNFDCEEKEGYVIRLERAFHYEDFSECVAKFVRKNHVQTNEHWKSSRIEINELSKKAKL